MAFTITDLDIDQGSTFVASVTVSNAGGNGVINLSGYTVLGGIRKYYTSSNVVAMNVQIVNATAGEITLNLDANTTGSMSSGEYVYDVLTLDTTNTATRILQGLVTVNPQVTSTPWQNNAPLG